MLRGKLEVQFWINRVASNIVFQLWVPDTGAPLHEERVIAVRQELNVHLSSTCETSLVDLWTGINLNLSTPRVV